MTDEELEKLAMVIARGLNQARLPMHETKRLEEMASLIEPQLAGVRTAERERAARLVEQASHPECNLSGLAAAILLGDEAALRSGESPDAD